MFGCIICHHFRKVCCCVVRSNRFAELMTYSRLMRYDLAAKDGPTHRQYCEKTAKLQPFFKSNLAYLSQSVVRNVTTPCQYRVQVEIWKSQNRLEISAYVRSFSLKLRKRWISQKGNLRQEWTTTRCTAQQLNVSDFTPSTVPYQGHVAIYICEARANKMFRLTNGKQCNRNLVFRSSWKMKKESHKSKKENKKKTML